MDPVLTRDTHEKLLDTARSGATSVECSLDLERSTTTVELVEGGWSWRDQQFPWIENCKDRTIYYWADGEFRPAARYTTSLIKLVPTQWGAPTFEIDGIKMLPTERVSPYSDAENKVRLIQPRGKVILDTCGGLGYFAAWCIQGQAAQVLSYEINPDVIWLRGLNPWSPQPGGVLKLTLGSVAEQITTLPDQSVDAILHDPPRFGIAGELYSQAFYDQLARVLRRRGRLFHYTGSPNKLTTGRDVPAEVMRRLQHAGFSVQVSGDGVLAVRR